MPETHSSQVQDPGVAARSASCAVLVMSCDAYRDLWTPFFTLFWRYWPDCPFPVYLGTNRACFDHPRVRSLAAGDHEWSNRLRSHLSEIETEYVLLLLEDYFFTEPISTEKIVEALCSLERLSGTVLRLYPVPGPDEPVSGYSNIGRIAPLASYRVSTQASIWNKMNLPKLLQEEESIWDFERRGSRRSRCLLNGFYSTYRTVLPYRQVVERGKWFRSAAKDFKGQQIGCDFTARPVMSSAVEIKKTIAGRTKSLLDRMLPPGLRLRI
jgi:hypothetical protein